MANVVVPRTKLGSLMIPRLVTGLWQVADMERPDGIGMDFGAAVAQLRLYAEAGASSAPVSSPIDFSYES
eukprot:SAG11_NODE_12763_length_686_cov_1.083475_1_plen_70_part_00